jgi:hypothetical protein
VVFLGADLVVGVPSEPSWLIDGWWLLVGLEIAELRFPFWWWF